MKFEHGDLVCMHNVHDLENEPDVGNWQSQLDLSWYTNLPDVRYRKDPTNELGIVVARMSTHKAWHYLGDSNVKESDKCPMYVVDFQTSGRAIVTEKEIKKM